MKIIAQSSVVVILFAALSSTAFADICDKEKEYGGVHCTMVNAPDGVRKIIQVTQAQGPYLVALGLCVTNRIEPLPISKEDVEGGRVSLGQHEDTYVQCNDMQCSMQKPLGVDRYTVNADHTVTPYKFVITLDPAFGQSSCEDNDHFGLRHAASCDGSKYCLSINNAATSNKYVKVVDNDGMFYTMCMNAKTHFVHDDSEEGSYQLAFYQCNDVQCTNSKLLGKDAIKVSPEGKFDHSTFSINLDPTFGQDCTPFPTN